MTLGVCYHAADNTLDELETAEFSIVRTKIKRVAVIQFRMHVCCWSSFQVMIRPYASKVPNVMWVQSRRYWHC